MSRRKSVELNLEYVKQMIKIKYRHNSIFCEKMGRPNHPTWVTDWGRKPKPKNLPSPEEAAQMCLLLDTTPEQILVNEADMELVRALLPPKEKEIDLTAYSAEALKIAAAFDMAGDDQKEMVRLALKPYLSKLVSEESDEKPA